MKNIFSPTTKFSAKNQADPLWKLRRIQQPPYENCEESSAPLENLLPPSGDYWTVPNCSLPDNLGDVSVIRDESKIYAGGSEDFRFSCVQILDPPFESREES